MSFQKIHLKLLKDDFQPASKLLPIEEEPSNYERFMWLLKKVGAQSNWDKRTAYFNSQSIKQLKDILRLSTSHLWLFKKGNKDIGFCQIANAENLTGLFNNASGISEIYKIGLFPEYIGKGLGKGYISSVIKETFKKQAHTIYLNTRDTNVVNSVPFYQRLGFQVIKTETLPDDLII